MHLIYLFGSHFLLRRKGGSYHVLGSVYVYIHLTTGGLYMNSVAVLNTKRSWCGYKMV